MTNENPPKQRWLKMYSIILIVNALYFIMFYLIMKAF